MFTVQRLDQNDAGAWASLRREAIEAHPLAFGASVPNDHKLLVEFFLTRLAPSEESAMFGAFTCDTLVGMVGIRRETGAKERHKSFVWGMYVTSSSRQRGAGEMLLRAAIEQARSWPGVEQVHLTVSDIAQDAQRLYEKHGFREWGRAPRSLCWQGRCVDEIYMMLDLCDHE